MTKSSIWLMLLSMLTLSACDETMRDQELREAKRVNEADAVAAFAYPKQVATLPDGTPVLMIVYRPDGPQSWPHYIYYAGATTTVNTRQAKLNTVYVMLNGKALTLDQAQQEIDSQASAAAASSSSRLRKVHE